MVQAVCELALPTFTSQIVDVGIQQSGIKDVACKELTEQTYESVKNQLSGESRETFEASYDLTENEHASYVLNDYGKAHIDALNALMAAPIAKSHGIDVNTADDSLVQQQGIVAAKAEYESLGYNLSDMQISYLLKTGGLMLLLTALGTCVAILIGLIASRAGSRISAELRAALFEKVVGFSDAEIQSFSAASLITRGTNDIQQIQNVIIMFLRMVLFSPIMAIGGIIMIAQTNVSMSWIVAVAVVAVAAIVVIMFKAAMPKFKLVQKLIDKVNLVAREMLGGAFVIRAFNREDFEQKRFDDANEDLMRTQLFTNRVMTFMMPSMMLIMNLVSVAIVWVGAGLVGGGSIQTGDIIAFINYAIVIIMSFLIIGMMSIMLPRADVAAMRVNEVLNTESSVKDPASGKCKDKALNEAEAHNGGAKISFNNVDFRYGNSSEYVLKDVSFCAESGQTTAIIGSTGAGKTTLLKLIMRFFDVSSGSITIDGIDIRDVTQKVLREKMGYVPQASFLFNGTIHSNVAYSNEDMDESSIEKAIEIAQAKDFVDSQTEGLDHPITQGGTNVSGGQRQRLSIARAIASDARVLLFDDSFSALDYKTDADLRAALSSEMSDKTVIIVAQRIATVLSADKIIVLDEGRVVGQGTHLELISSCPEYLEIARSQLSEEELACA